MDDSQLNNMVNMMKSNPAMMKANYEAQMGQKLTDEQFENMMNMMNPQMMKQASSMMQQNPDLLRQAQANMQAQGATGAGYLNTPPPAAAAAAPQM